MTRHLLPLLALTVFPSASSFFAQQFRASGRSSLLHHAPLDEEQQDVGDPAFKYYNRQDDQDIVTQEMLWRNLLEDPKVNRKSQKGSYRTLDNRDSLPFVVKVMTPDPYTPMSHKTKETRSAKRTDLVGGIAASLYTETSKGSLQKILGSFSLDKSTGPGDVLEVGGKDYEVQKARCQYKYAGGKRFVMVRKVLEVKEVVRVAEENYLKRQLRKTDSLDDPPRLE